MKTILKFLLRASFNQDHHIHATAFNSTHELTLLAYIIYNQNTNETGLRKGKY